MAAAIQLDPSRDDISSESYLPGRVAGKSSGGGGDMDQVLQRLGTVESSVSAIRAEVSGVAANIPHLATKEDLKKVEGQVCGIAAVIPHLATKEDLKKVEGQVNAIAAVIPHLATKGDVGLLQAAISGVEGKISGVEGKISGMETRIIKWIIATSIAIAALAFTIAKLVH
jgi:DNA-binding FrmR family transcriptional regulator